MRLRGGWRRGLKASARPGGWSALGLSVVSGAVALALILTSGTTSGSPAGGFILGQPGAVATTHMQLSADASAAAAAPVSPPTLPPNTSARQALTNAQSQLGGQLSSTTWGTQNSTVSSALTSQSALDNTHVWAAGASCTLLFSANGTTWTKDTHVPGGCSTNLTGVDVQDNSHGWAVGSGGVVLVCNANCNTATANWASLGGAGAPGSGVSFTGVWGNGNTVYASTSGAVWVCSTNCNATTVGSGGGKATWTNVALAGSWMSVAAAGGGTPAFLVGSTGAMRMCKTAPCTTSGAWVTISGFGATNFASVWAVDGNHIYAVGTNGSSGAIWGCSAACNNSVVGSGPGQAQWVNVTPVTPVNPLPPALTGVAGAGGPDGSAWAVGTGGAIWFCGSTCAMLPSQWVLESPSNPTTVNLAGVAASDPNHAWTDGAGGYIAGMVQAGPITDAINKALQGLGNVLDPTQWPGTDGNHINVAKFHQIFDKAHDAVAALQGIKPPQAWPSADLQLIEGAMRLLALTELNDNSCSPKNAKELTAAQKELDAGDKAWTNGDAPGANDHYKNAYDHANKAHGVPCAGLTVSPAGSLFTVTNMVPGDSDPTPTPGNPDAVLVTVTNSPGTVTLSTANVTGTLASQLRIKVQEYQVPGAPQTLYDDLLTSFPPSLALENNAGTTTNWGVNEAHNFVITVSLPLSTDNTFQDTNASFDLNWTRS